MAQTLKNIVRFTAVLVSVGFGAGDTISVKTVDSGATQDIIVVVELF